MKRKLFSLFTLFVISINLFAFPISESEARDKAMQFMLSKKGESSARSAHRFGGSGYTGANLTMAEAREAFYVFNIGSDGGYVIISGDNRMPDVLGYSYSGTYDADKIPENMRAWLEGYVEQHEYLQSHSYAKAVSLTSVSGDPILPLLDCHWDQDSPYNDQCPLVNGKRTLTGCIATAMAQIMYYHKWPKQTTKEIPAYTTNSMGIYMPAIGITSIDWDNMITSYSSTSSAVQKNAVATLMLLCGCSTKMDYNSNESGGHISAKTFVDYFSYNSVGISNVYRSNYDDVLWNQMIYDELKNDRPVYYSGYPDSGCGHSFVIDGYDCNDYFHVNWGWGGYMDNYFLLSALLEYNSNQSAIIGINHYTNNVQSKSLLPYAELKDSVLTFFNDNNYGSRTGILLNWDNEYWVSEDYKQQVTSVVFDPSCAEYKYLISTDDMFNGFSNMISIQGLEYLNTENVTDMSRMFCRCNSLISLDLGNFNTQNVTDMRYMFFNCTSLTSLDVSNFNTENVEYMNGMFSCCYSLKSLNVSKFDTKKVTDMGWMVHECTSLISLDLSSFDTNNVEIMSQMFDRCRTLEVIYVGKNWSTASVTSGNSMFGVCWQLIGEKGTQYSKDNTDYTYAHIDGGPDAPGYLCSEGVEVMIPYAILSNDNKVLTFYYGSREMCGNGMRIKTFGDSPERGWNDVASSIETVVFDKSFGDYSCINSTSYWFQGCFNLISIQGLGNLNTENVKDMSIMFSGCISLKSIDFSNFDTKNVTNMSYMFLGCSSLTSLDICNFDTRNVTDMSYMFYSCPKLGKIFVSEKWNTNKVTSGDNMFWCWQLIGEKGTKFSDNNTDYTYAHIDGGLNNPGYFTYKSSVLHGDVNGDVVVNGTDIQTIINLIVESLYDEKADVNLDGVVNGTDIQEVINIIVNAE